MGCLVHRLALAGLGALAAACHADAQPAAGHAPMIRLSGGSFTMGSDTGPMDERPAHRVELRPFHIDVRPVTNAEFARFLDTLSGRVREPTGRRLYDDDDTDARIHLHGKRWRADPGWENQPVIEASWHGARAYCAWRGKRLPSEAEWEFAARGVAGRAYPWGNAEPDTSRAHFARGYSAFADVGTYPAGATPDGVLDLTGNVNQWTSSLALPYPYKANDGREDRTRDGERVTRGGAADTGATTLRATWRGAGVSRNPRAGHHNIGFRCARDA
jgi:formylglycine-generating enzyme required for sulfatase activity